MSETMITVDQLVKAVQEKYPSFTRARMRGWIQRQGFPAATIAKSSTGRGPVEGFYPMDTVDYVLRILDIQKHARVTAQEAVDWAERKF